MAITVVCPGCYKRFSVSERFAGQKGPCPKCKVMIEIPKGEAKVHAPDDFAHGGKTTTGKLILKPIEREELQITPARLAIVCASILGIMIATAGLGAAGLFKAAPILAMLGQLIISPLYCLLLYPFLIQEGDLEPFRGKSLYVRALICGASMTVIWWAFELTAGFMFTGNLLQWVIVIPCFVLGTLAAFASFDLTPGNGFLLYSFYVVIMLLLRWMAGLGWVWTIVSQRVNDLPPIPTL